MPLILASTSPRRKALLEQIGLSFEVIAPNFEEILNPAADPHQLAVDLSLGKALSINRPDDIVIGSDTFIVFEGRFLGKPASPDDAIRMLKQLRNNQNTVLTGWAVTHKGTHVTGVVETTVWMGDISDDEIHAYVATGEPLDKAGSYAANGKAAVFIDRIAGSIDATVGLPLRPVTNALRQFGITLFD